MSTRELKSTIKDMVVVGKGILAADESIKTAAKRLASINVESTDETRRQYRNLMLTTPEIDKYICWGSPNDLKTYEYWQEYFHKAVHHPYKKELDEDFS